MTIEIKNPKAWFDYEFIDTFDAGMKLTGTDVKKILANQFPIVGNYVRIVSGEIFLVGDCSDHSIKLLMHKHEINKLIGKVQATGLTMIPMRIHERNGKYKLEFALARGKKEYDKRAATKARDVDIDNRRIIKSQKFGDA